MNYDALNIGDGELSLGQEFFTNLSARSKVPMLSANITGLPGVVPYLIKNIGGINVAITGVTAGMLLSPEADKTWGKGVVSPNAALQELIPKLRQQADVVILLSHLSYEGTVNLLQFNDLQGVDVAVAAHGRNLLDIHPERVGSTVIVQNSMGGEYLGFLKLRLSDAKEVEGLSSEVIALDETMPEDNKALEMMAAFHAEEKHPGTHQDKEQFNALKTKYLSMSPQQFVDELKKKRVVGSMNIPETPVPVQ